MTNVLLTKKYKGREAGSILMDLADGEATALETIGVGQKLKEEQPAPKKKGEKEGTE
ncbi:hypothetical protein [Rhizobium ruizarguesonis]|uniref:hypothetical protein n=1 Tax=Rhizobium ruizarguesonis TaxID=2081791 RepID=UPI0003FF14F9|nr:hypothetical protein [Rhizobium ruizarguesonis]QJS27468.1 hypothetical protein RLTA1_09295 [Rhizobium leguminosarum bv. trifolii TA1]UFW96222.1 hypothetical protein RlegTA1_09260 [Rhizobium ruizarguesonis]